MNLALMKGHKPNAEVKRTPKFTLQECADRLGVKLAQITATMRHDPAGSPKPELKFGSNGSRGPTNYYSFATVSTWWRATQAKRAGTE